MKRFIALAAITALLVFSATPAQPTHTNNNDVNPNFSGVISVRCIHSHVNNDDPIVFPGKQGAAHQHSYMGSKTTKYNSTLSSMRASASSCGFSKDTAGYWFPSLKTKAGVTVNPTQGFFYYREKQPGERVHAFPPNLKMIAGYPNTKTGGGRLSWSCQEPRPTHYPTIPDCFAEGFVVAQIAFPNCWDGRRTDSPDHRSHMAYAGPPTNRCPSTHPVRVPALTYHNHYKVANGKTGGYKLSSDGSNPPGSTLHADFWNTWDQPTLNRIVQKCLVENVDIPESTRSTATDRCRILED